MSSVALYRRYRPQTFEDVLGQEHVVETLQAAIRDGRIAHAYLFSGSRGTGKTSTARILAKALNCEKGPTPTPCNVCETCRSITEGSSLDVIEIDAASHGGVDDVRDLRENALLAPAIARTKVYIVDEAHMVSTQGWNAFLKTVEEPPGHVVFVFATTEPHKVLPTILSRCQRFDFRRVSSTTIAGHLAKVCAEEGIPADEGALHLIARAAEGGMRDALSTLDQLASAGSVTPTETARLLGTTTGDLLFEFTDAIASADTAAAIGAIARLVDEGQDLRVFGRSLLDHLRALLLSKQIEDPGELIDATEETRARLAAQAERFGAGRLVHVIRLFVDALADMRQQAAPRLTMELAVVRATMPEVDETAAAAVARIERLERLLEVGEGSIPSPGSPSPASAPAAPTPASDDKDSAAAPVGTRTRTASPVPASGEKDQKASASGVAGETRASGGAGATKPGTGPATKKKSGTSAAPKEEPGSGQVPSPVRTVGTLDLDKLRHAWQIVLEEVRKQSKILYGLLGDTTPREFDGQTIVLEARFAYHAEQLKEAKNARVIAGAINTALGVSPRIATVVGSDVAQDDAADDAGEGLDPLDVLKSSFGDDLIEE